MAGKKGIVMYLLESTKLFNTYFTKLFDQFTRGLF